MKPSSKREKILVVDDSPDTLEVLQRNLESKGYNVLTAAGAVEAIKILESMPVDLVITDLKMPEVDGLSLVRHVHENYKNTEVMMITGYPSIEGAVEAVKTGAEEYLAKPFTDEELFSAVRRVLEKLHMRKVAEKPPQPSRESRHGMIGESEAMRKVLVAIEKAASSLATILITGESGTGKELVARAIHYRSPRASAPFVPINCGGIPEPLLESELFGYVKGAFTGAVETRAGFFQTAEGGTIFLDEISETSLTMQVKLLRVLQDKDIFLVGARQAQKVDIRIIAATNKDLLTLVNKDEFREDLYYRLNVITIDIPPLREREEDILLLIKHFSTKFAKEFGKTVPSFSEEALQVLKSYDWPGNVRELENIIQRLIIMTEGDVIGIPDLPSLMRFSALRGVSPNRSLAEVEAEHIRIVLASVGGNKTQAARILGITRKTLRDKLVKR
ncbi:MAG: sigma-54 dependent transcriptional regulator [Candidatus Aminicenantes bacterium]|jgi:two-component system response regulator HydG|nr:sigma-54 dependent transcriptional regulator [Candidatus Aminicenantes bacterium]MDH5383422.1 sigma-54 dependent transcriptional regulator [Candidatus Aminicenantes bacterium]